VEANPNNALGDNECLQIRIKTYDNEFPDIEDKCWFEHINPKHKATNYTGKCGFENFPPYKPLNTTCCDPYRGISEKAWGGRTINGVYYPETIAGPKPREPETVGPGGYTLI
jgi:hypothetical protein